MSSEAGKMTGCITGILQPANGLKSQHRPGNWRREISVDSRDDLVGVWDSGLWVLLQRDRSMAENRSNDSGLDHSRGYDRQRPVRISSAATPAVPGTGILQPAHGQKSQPLPNNWPQATSMVMAGMI